MVGPPRDQVARCREKRQQRQLAIGQGLFRRPVFAASSGQWVVAGEVGQTSQFGGGNQIAFTPKRARESAPTQLSFMEIPTSASILDCSTIGASTQRYKLFLTAGDETGDTDFVLFGCIAQRIVKRPADILIAENPVGFMPDAITKLLERTFIWNVSFTKNTITSGNVCFQVNAIVGEIDTGNGVMSMSPGGSHQSSLMVSQGASSSLQNTPEKGTGLVLPTPLTPQGGRADTEDKVTPEKSMDLSLLSPGKTFEPVKSPIGLAESPVGTQTSDVAGVQKVGTDPGENASVLGDSSTTKKKENAARKRSRSSPNKATAKRLFTDGDDGGNDDQGCAEDTAEPGSSNV